MQCDMPALTPFGVQPEAEKCHIWCL